MRSKLLNLLLIITSLLGYLEWGGNNHTFLFQAEGDILSKIFTDPTSVAHPFVVLPMLGQFILLFTLFQRVPGKLLTYIAIGCLAILILLIFVIGLMSLNYKMLLSTIPFLVVAVMTIMNYIKLKMNGLKSRTT